MTVTTMRVGAADGTPLNVVLGGDPAAEPLLLVSGQGSDHSMWDPVVVDFDAAFRTIRWDARGTGASGKPQEPPYTITGFAADAVAILDALGAPRAHVYGISMGGRIAQRLAISWADRVGAVVLGCTTPGNAHGVARPPEVDAAMANRPTDPTEALRQQLERMVSPGYAASHPDYVAALRRRAENPIPVYAQKLHYAASEGHEAWDELPGVAAPVLVIHGTDDLVNVTANAPLLAGRIPGAELVLIEGGRHGFFVEFREQASAAVIDFLRRHPLA
ncbi:MAG: alpha/beta fold hydrolase [Acidimicrobiia bacterium]